MKGEVVGLAKPEVLRGNASSSLLLERSHFRAGPDRALATELVFGCLRRLRALDWVLAQVASRPLANVEPGLLDALRLGAYQLLFLERVPAYAAVGESVEIAKRIGSPREASFANGVLRSLERRRSDLALPGPDDGRGYLETTLSIPPWLAERWTRRFGAEATIRMAESVARPAAMVLRVITVRGAAAEVTAELAGSGVKVTPGRYLAEALRVEDGAVLASRAFREGRVTVQDEAAQLVAHLVGPLPGERVLDACAAPGGKSMALADGTGAHVVACDSRPGRLALVRANLERTRLQGVTLVAADAASPPFACDTLFDRVLVDAPCTGTGTLRRNPEVRYRVADDRLLASGATAGKILAAVAALVRVGGRLVYATCSLEPEENEHVIASFLATAAGGGGARFRPVDAGPLLPETARRLVGADGVLRTQPADPELDGFTAFVLKRES